MIRDPLESSFAAQFQRLIAAVRTGWHSESPDAGFVDWLVDRTGVELDLDVAGMDLSHLPSNRWSEAPILSAVGYRMASEKLADQGRAQWLDGIRRLAARDARPVDRNSFLFRPVELLGLVVGALIVSDDDPTPIEWLKRTVDNNIGDLAVRTFWHRGLSLMVAQRLGLAGRLNLEPHTPGNGLEAAMAVCLQMTDPDIVARYTSVSGDELERSLLVHTSVVPPPVADVAQAAAYAIALKVSVLHAIGTLSMRSNTAVALVCECARRFPVFAAELRKRHASRDAFEIVDEYDVQDLFRAVLNLHFADVRKEEWNPSYGGVQTRSDLLIKGERLVVETKMARKGLGQREVVEELTVDKAHYRGHPSCRTLVCLVYDPEHRLSNPTAIESDLSDRTEQLDTHVIVAPSLR